MRLSMVFSLQIKVLSQNPVWICPFLTLCPCIPFCGRWPQVLCACRYVLHNLKAPLNPFFFFNLFFGGEENTTSLSYRQLSILLIEWESNRNHVHFCLKNKEKQLFKVSMIADTGTNSGLCIIPLSLWKCTSCCTLLIGFIVSDRLAQLLLIRWPAMRLLGRHNVEPFLQL